jgi:hypothetical protein
LSRLIQLAVGVHVATGVVVTREPPAIRVRIRAAALLLLARAILAAGLTLRVLLALLALPATLALLLTGAILATRSSATGLLRLAVVTAAIVLRSHEIPLSASE